MHHLHQYHENQNPQRPPPLLLPKIWVRLGGATQDVDLAPGGAPKTFYLNFVWAPGPCPFYIPYRYYQLLPAPVCLLVCLLGRTHHAAYRMGGRASQPWSPEPSGTRLGGLPRCTLTPLRGAAAVSVASGQRGHSPSPPCTAEERGPPSHAPRGPGDSNLHAPL